MSFEFLKATNAVIDNLQATIVLPDPLITNNIQNSDTIQTDILQSNSIQNANTIQSSNIENSDTIQTDVLQSNSIENANTIQSDVLESNTVSDGTNNIDTDALVAINPIRNQIIFDVRQFQKTSGSTIWSFSYSSDATSIKSDDSGATFDWISSQNVTYNPVEFYVSNPGVYRFLCYSAVADSSQGIATWMMDGVDFFNQNHAIANKQFNTNVNLTKGWHTLNFRCDSTTSSGYFLRFSPGTVILIRLGPLP